MQPRSSKYQDSNKYSHKKEQVLGIREWQHLSLAKHLDLASNNMSLLQVATSSPQAWDSQTLPGRRQLWLPHLVRWTILLTASTNTRTSCHRCEKSSRHVNQLWMAIKQPKQVDQAPNRNHPALAKLVVYRSTTQRITLSLEASKI